MVQKSHTIYKRPLESYTPALIRDGERGNKIKKDFPMKKYTINGAIFWVNVQQSQNF